MDSYNYSTDMDQSSSRFPRQAQAWDEEMRQGGSSIIFAEIPSIYHPKKCDDFGLFNEAKDTDISYLWKKSRYQKYLNYFIWGGNEKNIFFSTGKKLDGFGGTYNDGPTCGIAKPNYFGILTVNPENRTDELQTTNENRFRKLKSYLKEGSNVVFPVRPVKNADLYEFSLGPGPGEARDDDDWNFIQKNIMENIIKLIEENRRPITIFNKYPLFWRGPRKKKIFINSIDDLKKIVYYVKEQLSKRQLPRQRQLRQQPRRRKYISRERAIRYQNQNRRLAPKEYPKEIQRNPYESRRLRDEVRRLKTKNEEYSDRIPKYKEKELREKISNLEKKVNERKTPSEFKELENRAKRYKEQVEDIQNKLNKCRRDKGESTDAVALKAKVDEYKRKLGDKQGNPAEVEKKLKEFEKRLKQVQVTKSNSTGNKEYDKLLLTFQKEQHKYKKCSQEIRKAKNSLEDWTKDMNLFISHFEECIQRNPDPSEKKHIAKIRKSEKEVRAQIVRLEKNI